MNILFLVPDRNDPTCFYRASGIAHDLELKSGHTITTLQTNEVAIGWQILSNFDLILMQRPFTKIAVDLIAYAKSMNKPIWVDYDDNLFALNPENKSYQVYNDPATQENVKNCLKAADAVSVPTEYLKQCYSQFNKNIEVIPNAFNDGIFKRGELKPRAKTAIWRGPDSHIYDMMSYAKEINRCCEEFPQWEFDFMGFYPWFLSKTENKGFVPGLDIIMYFKKLADLAPSVGHILLHDDTFNRCRSNVGFLEMSYAGAMCVVPSWWNVPGTLSYTDPASYYEAMRSVLSGEVDIVAQNHIAWDYITDCLLLSKVNVGRLQIINSLL